MKVFRLGLLSAWGARIGAMLGLAACIVLAWGGSGQAYTFENIFTLCTSCANGETPAHPLVVDKSGDIFGTGGEEPRQAPGGTVFQLVPDAKRQNWTERFPYRFCKTSCDNGRDPAGGLVEDANGDLYGTTVFGGAHAQGVVFRLHPNKQKTKWTQTVLYDFCAQSSCVDGTQPVEPLAIDGSGNLYGMTSLGGATGEGTLFELTPNSDKTSWTFRTLYTFCSEPDCVDGRAAEGVIVDQAGNVFGSTGAGGLTDQGVVFKWVPGRGTYTVIHSFCAESDCADGTSPNAIAMDGAGNIYGTTYNGGNSTHAGLVFMLAPNGTGWNYRVIYEFCSKTKCKDGSVPTAGVTVDPAGVLYGTTQYGGRTTKPCLGAGCGTAYSLTPNSDKTEWRVKIIHTFCTPPDCNDGSSPQAGLTLDSKGNLFGVTSGTDSPAGLGVVFELVK